MATSSKARFGFTLVETMVVVIIIGVLGTLGAYGVMRYTRISQSSEAGAVLNSIRAAEEVYRQDTFVYLDVSNGSFDNLHPSSKPGKFKRPWNGNGDSAQTAARFRELAVDVSGSVRFTYGVVAGRSGDGMPVLPTTKKNFNLPANATEPFYFAVAKGDLDGDGTYQYFLASSFAQEVYVENEGE